MRIIHHPLTDAGRTAVEQPGLMRTVPVLISEHVIHCVRVLHAPAATGKAALLQTRRDR